MRSALRARYIPPKSIAITEPGLGTVYVYASPRRPGFYAAIAYHGQSSKPDWHYAFKTDAELDAQVKKYFDGLRHHRDSVAARRVERQSGHSFKVGDIVTNSWGYDQTNVDWYCVVKVSTCYVWLQRAAAGLTDTPGTQDSGKTSLVLDAECKPQLSGEITKHHAHGDTVTMRHGIGSKWDGREMYTSWGH